MADHIAQYQALKAQRDRLDAQLREIEDSERFKSDQACRQDLIEMLEGYEKSPSDLPRLFPEVWPVQPTEERAKTAPPKRRRPLMRYTHPENGEQVESKGLNHKVLQAWIKEYDIETVKSWGVEVTPGTPSS